MLLFSGIERKQSKLPFESPTMVRLQEENGYKQLKIWIVMKQSTNWELNEPVLEWDECEKTHTLTTTTTGSKNSQKEAKVVTMLWAPQRSLLYRLLVLDEVKCKTHTQQQSQLMTIS